MDIMLFLAASGAPSGVGGRQPASVTSSGCSCYHETNPGSEDLLLVHLQNINDLAADGVLDTHTGLTTGIHNPKQSTFPGVRRKGPSDGRREKGKVHRPSEQGRGQGTDSAPPRSKRPDLPWPLEA